jgi:predicted ATPase
MPLEYILLRNYRSFDHSGAKLELNHEFTGVIGVNNSGKSSLLRAIYELRPVFQRLGLRADDGNLHAMLQNGNNTSVALQSGERIYPIYNDTLEPRITIGLKTTGVPTEEVRAVSCIIKRDGSLGWEIERHEGNKITSFMSLTGSTRQGGSIYLVGTSQDGTAFEVNWEPVRQAAQLLAEAMYIGPFRNAINSGGAPYFDLSVGKDFISQYDSFKTGNDPHANEAIRAMTLEL